MTPGNQKGNRLSPELLCDFKGNLLVEIILKQKILKEFCLGRAWAVRLIGYVIDHCGCGA